MSKLKECAYCQGAWEWETEAVLDFNLPLGKRIWPALCPRCRDHFAKRYKSGELNKTELLLEFSDISARIAKKCAALIRSDLIAQMQTFQPKKRGK